MNSNINTNDIRTTYKYESNRNHYPKIITYFKVKTRIM